MVGSYPQSQAYPRSTFERENLDNILLNTYGDFNEAKKLTRPGPDQDLIGAQGT
jgi:hypothetical protein